MAEEKGTFVQMAEYADECYEASIDPMRHLEHLKATGRFVVNGDGTFSIKPRKILSAAR